MSSLYNLGAKGYTPVFFEDREEFVSYNQALLDSLIGERLHRVWIVWSLEHDEAWMDSPVVFEVSEFQLELCCFNLDEFSVTKNSIDIKSGPIWYGDDHFEWRLYKQYDRECVFKEIRVVEILSQVSNVTDQPGFKGEWWNLGGLQFISKGCQIAVFNGLDSNAISEDLDLGEGTKAVTLTGFR
jgi:hypothetical protein